MSLSRIIDQANIRVTDAIRYYREKQYHRAAAVLHELLDEEPRNIEARLLLASCFLFSARYYLAGQAFLHVVENAQDPDLRLQGLRGIESVRKYLQNISHVDDSFAESAVHLLCKKAIATRFL